MISKKFLVFALGPVVAAVLGFISVPLLAWFYSPEEIGRIAMLQVAITFCLLLFGLGLDQAYVREYYESTDRSGLLYSTLMPGLFFLVVGLAPFVFFPEWMALILFDVSDKWAGILVLFIILVSFLSRFFFLMLRLQEESFLFFLCQVLPKLALILLILGYVFFSVTPDIFSLLAANFLSLSAVIVVFFLLVSFDFGVFIRKTLELDKLRRMLAYCLPMLLSGVAYWGLTAVDKIFVRSFSTFGELGMYSVAVSFAALATIFQNVFGLLWSPWVYRKYAENGLTRSLMVRIQRQAVVVVVVIFCLMGMFSWTIDWVIPSNYSSVKYIVVACVGLPVFYTLSEVTGVGVGITRRTMLFMCATFFALAVSVLLNYFLVPVYGGAGAAVSTCISLWLFFVLKTEISNYIWQRFSRVDVYFLPTACLLLAVLMALKLLPYPVIFISWLGVFLITVFVFRRDFLVFWVGLRSMVAGFFGRF